MTTIQPNQWGSSGVLCCAVQCIVEKVKKTVEMKLELKANSQSVAIPMNLKGGTNWVSLWPPCNAMGNAAILKSDLLYLRIWRYHLVWSAQIIVAACLVR